MSPCAGMELVCPAGGLPALRSAVDHGADVVYIGFRDAATNARNFPGLNFSLQQARRGIDYTHARDCKLFVAINTYPGPDTWPRATAAVDQAAELGADAVILADPGLLHYCHRQHPELRLHLSVQGSATNLEAIRFYHEQFGIERVVLPRVLSLKQVERLSTHSPVALEVFAYGSLCVMVEGRCALSSYVTGASPNNCGVCSPASAVRWEETPQGRQSRLNGVLMDRYAATESSGYPTLCKGRFRVADQVFHAIEEPTSLNVLDLLPQLAAMGIAAVKVEGRQRSPAYVAEVTQVMRQALDRCHRRPDTYSVSAQWMNTLDKLSEGRSHTLGALHRPWQ